MTNVKKEMTYYDSSKGVQDAISAMHCKGIGLKDVKKVVKVNWCHTKAYYERDDAQSEAASELFANMCGAEADQDAKKYIKKYFPNAYEIFINIIKDVGK